MLKILCDFCICVAITNTPCPKCEYGVTKEKVTKVISTMEDKAEFMSLSCYRENEAPVIDYHTKFGFGPSVRK